MQVLEEIRCKRENMGVLSRENTEKYKSSIVTGGNEVNTQVGAWGVWQRRDEIVLFQLHPFSVKQQTIFG